MEYQIMAMVGARAATVEELGRINITVDEVIDECGVFLASGDLLDAMGEQMEEEGYAEATVNNITITMEDA